MGKLTGDLWVCTMNREFWLQRWACGEIGFHQADINSYLQRYWSALEVPVGASVLVPLCGKSRDMAWLIAQGYAVLGVEVSRQAAAQFFSENGLQASHEPCPPFIRYYATGIDLLVGDIFDLEPDAAIPVEAVYDRASLVALPSTMRLRYAEHLAVLLRPGVRMLVIAFEYDQNQMQGPPFAVLESEMHDLYADTFQLEVLGAADVLDNYPRFRERGLTWLNERVYRLTRRR
ncbi:MAG: thiopurine S-methyltransferase [Nitrococcus sp.]|nr:thiopurine S-methyltransferase [Nitrococcus sp.]